MKKKTILCPDCGVCEHRACFVNMEGKGNNRLTLTCKNCARRLDFVVGVSK